MTQIWALIVDSFRESRDRKIFWVMIAISVLIALTMACFGFEPGKVNILFGLWEIPTDHFTVRGAVRRDLIATAIVDFIWDVFPATIGMTLAIIATAGFFPAMMRQGAIEVVVSKPMPRWMLFVGKYLGGLVFMFVQAAVFVVLTFLVAGVRWGVWLPGYLYAIPLLVLLFSYIYCVSVLVAVYFRSTVVAIILSMVAWVGFAGVQTMDDMFTLYPSWQENRTALRVVRVARWIVPKTQDVTYLAKRLSGGTVGTELIPSVPESDQELVGRAENIEIERMNLSPAETIGSSLLFEITVLMLACWQFSRRDY